MKKIFIILLVLFIFPLNVNAQFCEGGNCTSDDKTNENLSDNLSNNQIRMHKNTYQSIPAEKVRVIRNNRPLTVVRVIKKGENAGNYCIKYPYDFACQNLYNDYYMFPPPPPPPPTGMHPFKRMPPPPPEHYEKPNQQPQSSPEYRAIHR